MSGENAMAQAMEAFAHLIEIGGAVLLVAGLGFAWLAWKAWPRHHETVAWDAIETIASVACGLASFACLAIGGYAAFLILMVLVH